MLITIESHIADVRIKVKAMTLKDLFSDGIQGLYAVMQPVKAGKNIRTDLSIHLNGADRTVLFIDFLNDVLSNSLINRCVYNTFVTFRYNDLYLEAALSGQKVRSFSTEVKAVTFHEAEILESASGMLQTTFILDI